MQNNLDRYFNESHDENTHIYGDLATLYDFVYEKHYNYENQLRLVKKYADPSHKKVLEGACGTGRLSSQLSNEFSEIVAFDLNEEMLRIARRNYPKINFRTDDMLDLNIEQKFDLYAVLGNAMVHLTRDEDFGNFASEAYSILEEDSILIFDYMPADRIINGYSGTDVFEDENYRVKRDTITTKKGLTKFTMSFSFEITNKQTCEKTLTGESMIGRAYQNNKIKEKLKKCGFSSVEIIDYDHIDGAEIKDKVAVARI